MGDSVYGGVSGGAGLVFSLARSIAVKLLERSLQDRLTKLVEQEVRAAVLEHIGPHDAARSVALVQLVVGEVYNVAERFDGVNRVDNVLHLANSDTVLRSRPVDDPHLDMLTRRASARLQLITATSVKQPAATSPMFPTAYRASQATTKVPTFDANQRLTADSANQYRHRLERLAREDQVR